MLHLAQWISSSLRLISLGQHTIWQLTKTFLMNLKMQSKLMGRNNIQLWKSNGSIEFTLSVEMECNSLLLTAPLFKKKGWKLNRYLKKLRDKSLEARTTEPRVSTKINFT